MIYKPIRAWADLPQGPPSTLSETSALDFKSEHVADAAEVAKDMAAFANALGGTILVGVAEKSDSFTRKLLTVEVARRVSRDYEDAARDLLSPHPAVDPVVVSSPNGEGALVAVNVDPFPGQLVGARLPGTHGWRYPIRTAARHCTYVDPEKSMIYSNPRTRKAAILLSSIPREQQKSILVQIMERHEEDGDFSTTEELLDGELRSLSIEENTASFSAYVSDRSLIAPFSSPLEDVEAVWRSQPYWTVRLNGSLRFYRNFDGRVIVQYMSGRGPKNW